MYLEKPSGKGKKWIRLTLDKKKVKTEVGGFNVKMKTTTRTYAAPAKAKAVYEAAIAAHLADGFTDPNFVGEVPKPTPRDAGLEAAIRANRDDLAAYQVYADWLQQQENPLGELIVLQQQAKKARAQKLIDAMKLPGENRATYGWRSGFWQWLRLDNDDWTEGDFLPVELAKVAFAQPVCAVLEELRIGLLRWDENYLDVPAILGEAKKHAWAADLAKLRVGDISGDIDMAHHQVGAIGKPITKAFPNLRSLWVHSGDASYRKGETFSVAGLDLPELRELTIETCSLSKQRLASIVTAKLPKLERLTLWFGSRRYNCDANIKGLTKILSGEAFPKLEHLGLCNAEFENEIAIALAHSRIVRQLESIDLSRGTLTETGLSALIAAKKSMPKLAALNLDRNFLTDADIRALKKAFPFATYDRQKQADDSVPGEIYYYVSVSE